MKNITGKQLVEQGIITGLIGAENIQQHGIDLNLIQVSKIIASFNSGFIPKTGKTILAYRQVIDLVKDFTDGEWKYVWKLDPGTYDITFAQGCKIPADKMLLIRQRSSLLRNGTILHSSVFDAGFATDRIGTVMVVNETIMIEAEARVAQIYAHNSEPVENLYNGQWQGDKQRLIII